jgi:vitamin B12 transporter
VPEQSRSVELGVEQALGDLTLGVTLFYTEIDDLIRFSGGGYDQVAGTSVTQGVELTADYALSDALSVFGNYTFTDAEDQNGNRLRRVPRHDVLLGIAGEFARNWNGSFTVQHVADRVDPGPMPDYTLANAQVAYGLTDTTEVYLRVENLLDEAIPDRARLRHKRQGVLHWPSRAFLIAPCAPSRRRALRFPSPRPCARSRPRAWCR